MNELTLYKASKLESTFIEICNPKTTVIIGCIYKHPNVNINEFNDHYLNELLYKLFKEKKTMFLPSDSTLTY